MNATITFDDKEGRYDVEAGGEVARGLTKAQAQALCQAVETGLVEPGMLTSVDPQSLVQGGASTSGDAFSPSTTPPPKG